MLAPRKIRFAGPLGIVGFGAFGQLIAEHLRSHFRILSYDIECDLDKCRKYDVEPVSCEEVARCPIVVLAVPAGQIREATKELAPFLRPGTLVLDVVSIKIEPARIMKELLPKSVDVVATHPLFGPQSARNGINGMKIVVCPVRGRCSHIAAFFKKIGLEVIITTPEDHDRQAAETQGLLHAIAHLLNNMNTPATRITTRSYELMMSSIEMIRYDSTEVSETILEANPFAAEVLRRLLAAATELNKKHS
ncbi:prephenate dehydrogenase [Agrobacterium rhizogenes]|nr:prephenate dehydrogenase [Rhizobium rhizogenes]